MPSTETRLKVLCQLDPDPKGGQVGGCDGSRVEEDGGAGELNAGEEDLGELVVTRGDGPERFELVEETVNEIAFAAEGEIARARRFSVGLAWDDWRDRSSVEGADEGVGVERLIGDQSAGIDGFDS